LHDLLLIARRGRMLGWAGESQYDVEPKRLARRGNLAARGEPGKTRTASSTSCSICSTCTNADRQGGAVTLAA
jgi:hypothetical protein